MYYRVKLKRVDTSSFKVKKIKSCFRVAYELIRLTRVLLSIYLLQNNASYYFFSPILLYYVIMFILSCMMKICLIVLQQDIINMYIELTARI